MIKILFFLIIFIWGCDTKPTNTGEQSGISTTGNNGAIAAKFIAKADTDTTAFEGSFAYLYYKHNNLLIDSAIISLNNEILFDSLETGFYDIFVRNDSIAIGNSLNISVSSDSTVSVSIVLNINITINNTTINNAEGDIIVLNGPSISDTIVIYKFDHSGSAASGNSFPSSSSVTPLLSSIFELTPSSIPSQQVNTTYSSSQTNTTYNSSSASLQSSAKIDSSNVSPNPHLSSSANGSHIEIKYLSDLQHQIVDSDQSKYDLKFNTNVNENAITLNGAQYAKGLATYANSSVEYFLNGEWDYLEVDIGLDDMNSDSDPIDNVQAAAKFKIILDGVLSYISPVMRFHTNTQRVRLNIVGVNTMILTTNREPNTKSNYTVWANPVIWKGDSLDYVNPYSLVENSVPYSFVKHTTVDNPNLGSGWTSCRTFDINSIGYILCIKMVNGDVIIRKIDATVSNTQQVHTSIIKDSITSFEIFTLHNQNNIFVYDSTNGEYSIYSLATDGSIDSLLLTDTITAGWDDFTFYTIENTPYIFPTNNSTGAIHIYELTPNGEITTLVFDTIVTPSYNNSRYFEVNGNPFIIMNNSSNAAHATYAIQSDGSLGDLKELNGFTQSWTLVRPYYSGGKTFLYLYDDSTGNIQNYQILDDGSIGPINSHWYWSSGWSEAEFVEVNGRSALFILKGESGRSELIRNTIESIMP
ncbi:MAG: NPCBM/NEW2 domain-containing protein [Reichenbachiella sp.]